MSKLNFLDRRLCALAWLIAAQALITLLAGANLVWPWTKTSLAAGEFVRWREMFSLLLITPGSAALLFLVIWTLERGRADATGPLALFVVAVCFAGISMGVHEPFNVLERVAGKRLASSVYFWDEVFSHAVFFAAYVAISLALVWSQVRNPLPSPMGAPATALFAACGVVAGLGICCTEIPAHDIRVDLTVMVAAIVLAEWLRKRRPFALLPVNITLEGAYLLAVAVLIVAKF